MTSSSAPVTISEERRTALACELLAYGVLAFGPMVLRALAQLGKETREGVLAPVSPSREDA